MVDFAVALWGNPFVSDSDLRSAARVPCDVPMRIFVDGAWHAVRILDISRNGVRLRVPLPSFGFEPGTNLAVVAAYLVRVVPRRMTGQFNPDRLGNLINRELAIIRIGLPDDSDAEVELGCAMDGRLGDIEAAALELEVPREGHSPQEEGARHPYQPRNQEGVPPRKRRDLDVVVRARDGDPSKEWTGAPESMDRTGLVIRFRDRTRLGLDPSEDDARSLTVAFSDVYGPRANLEIREGGACLFRGEARLTRVEVEPRRPGELVVGFEYARELEPAERRALKLAR